MIAAARTGKESTSKIVVNTTDQQNKLSLYPPTPLAFIFIIVTRKLIDPRILEMPARWREKIAQSTDGLEWASPPASGG